jgi:uncharacterized membrane protein (DUF4010 family)
VALGVGLLIGAERERRKRSQRSSASAGIRTFAVAALSGATSLLIGGPTLLAVVTGAIALMAAVMVRAAPTDDPGLTTEIALVLTVLVGALALPHPRLAAGVGVTVAILLAARSPLHHFVGSILREHELRDALVLAGATFVVLPLLPDRAMGPFQAFNPHSIWLVAVLILAIGAVGHVAVRCLGATSGLPVAGLASGFISSTATIGAMGAHAAKAPAALQAATAGATLSTVATIIQLVAVIGVISPPTLRAMALPLACAGLMAMIYGAAFTVLAVRQAQEEIAEPGDAFSVPSALLFAGTLALILVLSAALHAWFGGRGAIAAAAIAGLLDPHAVAISLASLAASGRLAPEDALAPILIGLSTNTLTKLGFAFVSGGRAFTLRVAPGLVLVAAAAWFGAWVSQ